MKGIPVSKKDGRNLIGIIEGLDEGKEPVYSGIALEKVNESSGKKRSGTKMQQNYKMTVRYDGTRYLGWEHQPGKEWTVQGKLEMVLTEMLKSESEKTGVAPVPGGTGVNGSLVTVIAAGRTDAGVHAEAMTANVILDSRRTPQQIRSYMNRYLPEDISIDTLEKCAAHFHARYNARGKTYRYTCWYAEEKPVFRRKYVTVLEKKPDVAAMRRAAEYLTGMHDYKSFCGNSHFKKSSVRVVDRIEIQETDREIIFLFHGNGFLQNMVRILTGTLLEVGYGKRTPESMTEILEMRNRQAAGPTAPPGGLALVSVDY